MYAHMNRRKKFTSCTDWPSGNTVPEGVSPPAMSLSASTTRVTGTSLHAPHDQNYKVRFFWGHQISSLENTANKAKSSLLKGKGKLEFEDTFRIIKKNLNHQSKFWAYNSKSPEICIFTEFQFRDKCPESVKLAPEVTLAGSCQPTACMPELSTLSWGIKRLVGPWLLILETLPGLDRLLLTFTIKKVNHEVNTARH